MIVFLQWILGNQSVSYTLGKRQCDASIHLLHYPMLLASRKKKEIHISTKIMMDAMYLIATQRKIKFFTKETVQRRNV